MIWVITVLGVILTILMHFIFSFFNKKEKYKNIETKELIEVNFNQKKLSNRFFKFAFISPIPIAIILIVLVALDHTNIISKILSLFIVIIIFGGINIGLYFMQSSKKSQAEIENRKQFKDE